jgi:hypothetical protein
MRTSIWILPVILAVMSVLPMPLAAQEQGSESQEVNGVIKDVSINVRRLTIETTQHQERIVSVEPETRIMVNQREGKLEELKPGQTIRVVLPKESSKAILIDAT